MFIHFIVYVYCIVYIVLNETAGSDMKSIAAPAVNNRKYVNKIENFCHISRGLNETAGSVSAVSLRPQDWFPRSH
jgi:hypothetical protein